MKSLDNQLESERLILIPLSYDQILKYWKSDGSLEISLGLPYNKGRLSDEMLLVIERSIIPFLCLFPKLSLYGTLWVVVDKATEVIVGDIGFKGGPTEKGLIEVGYETYKEYYNKGYMTEALQLISTWGLNQPDVYIIIAETDKSNLASQRILYKSGFEIFAETPAEYWWRLDKQTEDNQKLYSNEEIFN